VEPTSQAGNNAADPNVAATVRLLHRRHGWSAATVIGFFGFFIGLGIISSANSTGALTPSWFVDIVIVLGVLFVGGIIAYVADSVRLGRRPPEVRAQAAPIAARHPRGPRAHHYPPRHAVTWTVGWIGMALILVVAVVSVPALVDGVAFLTGAEKTATFDPTSYQTTCRYTCETGTDGTLETGGAGLSVIWPDVVPLGRPFPVREPVWRWGLGVSLFDGDGIAAIAVAICLLIEGFAVLILVRLVRLARNWRRHRQQRGAGALTPTG
jgi:hypothetical protein